MQEIGNALRRAGRENIAMHSIIARSISYIYGKEVEIKSVQIKGNKVLIRTGKSILNSELMMKQEDIKKESIMRLSKIGISLSETSIFFFI